MSAMMANFMSLLHHNFKATKRVGRLGPDHLVVLNEGFKSRVANRLAEGAQFVFGAFVDQFDPPVGQITDQTANFESADDFLDRVAKPDALDSSRVKNLHPCALHGA